MFTRSKNFARKPIHLIGYASIATRTADSLSSNAFRYGIATRKPFLNALIAHLSLRCETTQVQSTCSASLILQSLSINAFSSHHGPRIVIGLSRVVPKIKLRKIPMQMLLADMMKRAVDSTFQ